MDRGTAMVETVSVLGFVLALLFGTAQIALAGFYQLQLDAATFFYSHTYALTNGHAFSPQALQSAVPAAIPNATINSSGESPPSTSEADADGITVLGEMLNGGIPGPTGNPNYPLTNRYGGASIIRPEQWATTGTLDLSSFDFSLFGTKIVLTAGNIEGAAMVANHDDNSEGYGYNTNSAGSAADLVSPDTTGGDDQNVPPYYVTQAYMYECSWNGGPGGFDCAGANGPPIDDIVSLGLAEYLQDNSNNGASNGNYATSNDGIGYATSGPAEQLFGAMTLHQQVYASMAQTLLTSYPTYSLATAPGNNSFVIDTVCLSTEWDVPHRDFPTNGDFGTEAPPAPLQPIPTIAGSSTC
jgi:hypothetical protein